MRHLNRYLQLHPMQPVIDAQPNKNLALAIVIPCLQEPDTLSLVEHLQACTLPDAAVEILIVVNQPADAHESVREANAETLAQLRQWPAATPKFQVHAIKAFDLPVKDAGVGMARKIGMDEAARRFTAIGKPDGIIVSLDADCRVSENYLNGIIKAFEKHPAMHAATFSYAHRLQDITDARHLKAITCYELFLRYIELGWRYAGLPYAFTSIGSCFATRANAYARHHGMNQRKAGEDFYFLHKLARERPLSRIREVYVYPSARMSSRTPFGTGQAVSDFYHGEKPDWQVVAPKFFEELRCMQQALPALFETATDVWLRRLPERLARFLEESGIEKATRSMRSHAASPATFCSRYFVWFDGLKAWRYVNRDDSTMPIEKAAAALMEKVGAVPAGSTASTLLEQFRQMAVNQD